MTLCEQWLQKAYDRQGLPLKKFWDDFAPQEEKIYKKILVEKPKEIKGTIKELSDRYGLAPDFILGFIDGINEATTAPYTVEQIKDLEEDSEIYLGLDYEKLFKKMVEFKAEHLYTLPEWDGIYNEEQRKNFYVEQKRSATVVKKEKIGRNEPCTCGSGKKYKKCCGAI